MLSPNTRAAGFEQDSNVPEGKTIDRYFLLVIAVDQYQDGIPVLHNPVRDAAAITRILTDRYNFHKPELKDLRDTDPAYADRKRFPGIIPIYKNTRTFCLYNQDATSLNITNQLDAINAEIGENDALLIYCAGHGETGPNNAYYFIPYDGKKANRNSWFRVSDFYSYYENYTADKKCSDLLVVLDCCYAGKMARGFGKRVGASFSRYVLTSCLSVQQASDGQKNTGSSFARALEFVLDENTATGFAINRDALSKKFQQFYKKEFNAKPVQDILYTQLPTETGESEFTFELGEKNVPPVHVLSDVFIKYLNFSEQKYDFQKHYGYKGVEDLVIISTICKNINVQKLQVKMFFEALKNLTGQDLVFSSPVEFYPDTMNMDIWTALKTVLHIDASDNISTHCVRNVCDRLLVDNADIAYNQPLIVYCGCSFQSPDQGKKIMSFCKEFIEKVSTLKKEPEYQLKTFKKLLLLIADTRDGSTPFIDRDEMVNTIGTASKVVVARAVDDLYFGPAITWYQDVQKLIQTENFKNLAIKSYFEHCDCYNLEAFILQVSKDLGVDQEVLASHLWSYS
jgi:Caspase domain